MEVVHRNQAVSDVLFCVRLHVEPMEKVSMIIFLLLPPVPSRAINHSTTIASNFCILPSSGVAMLPQNDMQIRRIRGRETKHYSGLVKEGQEEARNEFRGSRICFQSTALLDFVDMSHNIGARKWNGMMDCCEMYKKR